MVPQSNLKGNTFPLKLYTLKYWCLICNTSGELTQVKANQFTGTHCCMWQQRLATVLVGKTIGRARERPGSHMLSCASSGTSTLQATGTKPWPIYITIIDCYSHKCKSPYCANIESMESFRRTEQGISKVYNIMHSSYITNWFTQYCKNQLCKNARDKQWNPTFRKTLAGLCLGQ